MMFAPPVLKVRAFIYDHFSITSKCEHNTILHDLTSQSTISQCDIATLNTLICTIDVNDVLSFRGTFSLLH